MRFGSLIPLLLLVLALGAATEQCMSQTDGATYAGGLSSGSNPAYYTGTCQSQYAPNGGGGGGRDPNFDPNGVRTLISRDLFDRMLLNRNDPRCPAKGFYTYDDFIDAARLFPDFGTTGNTTKRKQEIAAFLAQTSHETTGGWASAPDGPYTWGYCFVNGTKLCSNYCVNSTEWPCVFGKKYYGRGPMQISCNDIYGPAGSAIYEDLLNNPDLVATDRLISFKTALWFWMTRQPPQPPQPLPQPSWLSCHEAITGHWPLSQEDRNAGWLPGYGLVTNIINGRIECGHGPDPRMEDRMGFYRRYCDLLGVGYGPNQDCYNQKPYDSS